MQNHICTLLGISSRSIRLIRLVWYLNSSWKKKFHYLSKKWDFWAPISQSFIDAKGGFLKRDWSQNRLQVWKSQSILVKALALSQRDGQGLKQLWELGYQEKKCFNFNTWFWFDCCNARQTIALDPRSWVKSKVGQESEFTIHKWRTDPLTPVLLWDWYLVAHEQHIELFLILWFDAHLPHLLQGIGLCAWTISGMEKRS
jgi:hypothetical protein